MAHVEAGLRTFDMRAPFPEEMNRVFIGRLAALHFAPTKWAADNLLREGVVPQSIEITGNTGIDAVLAIRDALEQGRIPGIALPLDQSKKLILVTAHRRESFGDPLVEFAMRFPFSPAAPMSRSCGPFIPTRRSEAPSMQPSAGMPTSL